MPKDSRYTAVNMSKEAKIALERLQVVLGAQVGRRLSFGETIILAAQMLAPPQAKPATTWPDSVCQHPNHPMFPDTCLFPKRPAEDPCADGRCVDPVRHAEGGHDV
jgi:hypothetical protein